MKRSRGTTLAALATVIAVAIPVVAMTTRGATATAANVDAQGNPRPQGCAAPTRKMTMYAEELRAADGTLKGLAWGTTPDNASIPGPTIEMIEGECLEITVVNDVSKDTLRTLANIYGGYRDGDGELGVSLHVHGVKYTSASDGTSGYGPTRPGSYVPPGESRTYTWYAEPRATLANGLVSQGTAGYWWYHDHVVGTKHGTGGIYEGLYGALIVRRPNDPKPDKTFPLFMGPGMKINGMVHSQEGAANSDCPSDGGHGEQASPHCLLATQGERVEFVVVNLGEEFHTFHLHGHSWADNRTGLLTDPTDETRVIDAKGFGPSESFGFQVIAGHQVGPGDWMLHCHIQDHSDRGMMTFFRVR